jgi:four helix bundle protein
MLTARFLRRVLGMTANTYRELAIWQLATELRDKTLALLATIDPGADRDLFDQLRRSVSGPAGNIAEGFGRFEPRDFARYLVIAKASLDETDTHLRDLATRRHHIQTNCGELVRLAARCRVGVVRLRSYLLSPQNPYAARRRPSRDL